MAVVDSKPFPMQVAQTLLNNELAQTSINKVMPKKTVKKSTKKVAKKAAKKAAAKKIAKNWMIAAGRAASIQPTYPFEAPIIGMTD